MTPTDTLDLDHDACYRAIAVRDARFDGRLFTGVKTTGIYCRPICPARPRDRRTSSSSPPPPRRTRPDSGPACAAARKPLSRALNDDNSAAEAGSDPDLCPNRDKSAFSGTAPMSQQFTERMLHQLRRSFI
jgi:hypothetical protein